MTNGIFFCELWKKCNLLFGQIRNGKKYSEKPKITEENSKLRLLYPKSRACWTIFAMDCIGLLEFGAFAFKWRAYNVIQSVYITLYLYRTPLHVCRTAYTYSSARGAMEKFKFLCKRRHIAAKKHKAPIRSFSHVQRTHKQTHTHSVPVSAFTRSRASNSDTYNFLLGSTRAAARGESSSNSTNNHRNNKINYTHTHTQSPLGFIFSYSRAHRAACMALYIVFRFGPSRTAMIIITKSQTMPK